LKDKGHLDNCSCLEQKAQELADLFTNSLKEYQEKLKECKCEVSNKIRTPYYDFANYGYTYCEKCEVEIKGAGKHGVIKNRNNPRF
jgi:RNA polymerase-binding transcription factor DksA